MSQSTLFETPAPTGPRLAAPRRLPADVDPDRIICDWRDIGRPHSDRVRLDWCTRDATDDDPICAFVGINPSSAGDKFSDATCSNCWGFARRAGFKRYAMLNLCSAPATEPVGLLAYSGIEGNIATVDRALNQIGSDGGRVVVAWGALSGPPELRALLHGRRNALLALLRDSTIPLWCLGTNADGSPRHPSRLGRDVEMVRWYP